MKYPRLSFAFVFAVLAAGGCQQAPEGAADTESQDVGTTVRTAKTISDPRLVLAPVSGNPAALYFELGFEGEGSLTLTGADIAQAGATMLHDVERKDGQMKMTPLGPVTLTDGEKVSFAPGGKHVMAMQLDEAVAAGDSVDVTLSYEDGSESKFSAEVQAFGQEEQD